MNTKEISFLLLFKMSKNCIAVEMNVINVNNNFYRQSSKQFFYHTPSIFKLRTSMNVIIYMWQANSYYLCFIVDVA